MEVKKNCKSLRKAVWPFLIVKMCKKNLQKDLYKNAPRRFIFKSQKWKQTKSIFPNTPQSKRNGFDIHA